MSASASATDPRAPPAQARNQSIEARRAARLERFKRERLIIDYLNRGVSVREIAVQLGVTEKRMRAIVRDTLAAHMPRPPEEFVALEIRRSAGSTRRFSWPTTQCRGSLGRCRLEPSQSEAALSQFGTAEPARGP